MNIWGCMYLVAGGAPCSLRGVQPTPERTIGFIADYFQTYQAGNNVIGLWNNERGKVCFSAPENGYRGFKRVQKVNIYFISSLLTKLRYLVRVNTLHMYWIWLYITLKPVTVTFFPPTFWKQQWLIYTQPPPLSSRPFPPPLKIKLERKHKLKSEGNW